MAEKKKKKIGAWIIVGIVLVGLAGFGTGGLTGNIRTLGTVGEKDITVAAYQRTLDQQIRALSAQFGSQISFQQAQAFGIDRQALSQVVQTRTLDNEAAEMGISAGDMAVFERISAIQAFQGAGGFNRETYRLVLQQTGQSESAFEAEIREDLARTLLQASVVAGVPGSAAAADALVRYVAEARDVTLLRVTDALLTAPVPGATAADISAFYDANPDMFLLPEAREITYAWMTPAMIQDQMDVTDLAIETLYQDRIAEFIQPERRLVERLNYADRAAAQAAADRLAGAQTTFDALVAERGLTLADVDMGDLGRDDLPADTADAVFTASPGDVVGPFQTTLGAALFRVNAVLNAQEVTLQEAADDLRAELAAEAARSVINDDFDRITDLLAGGATLEDLAERTDLVLGQISWTPQVTEGIAAYDNFRDAAEALTEGAFPQLEVLSDGGVFALRLDGVTPARVPPLDTIRADVAARWQAQAQQDAVLARAAEIAAGLTADTDLAALGLTPRVESNLTRRSFVEGTPEGFNEVVFALTPGEARVVDAGNGALILRLDAITAADPTATDQAAQRAAITQSIGAGIAQDLFDAYAQAVQQSTRITINQATVDAVNAQLQ
ncbi:peptidylprolyl isomerase [Yoonia vestfoldensis]|uniref:Parvulin-like PPIase n=1 Tax=Yoonia vestfoldensis TaxID=245188 RepID=A0A1Y0EB14_9RHOB|nr:peptidylprolyl isomerase [Yoonia vestfoldensis]ARU00580.1 peptidyl-prolyl cis-trans isomerase D [Yoonia vestfoldensis]